MNLTEFLDLAYRSIEEMPRVVWLQLGAITTVLFIIFLTGQVRRRLTHARLGLQTRGICARCEYNPDTGTKVCPECGGGVLDLRLFRPVGRPARDSAAPRDSFNPLDPSVINSPPVREPSRPAPESPRGAGA